MLSEVFQKINFRLKRFASRNDKNKPNISYSQCGEDLIIDYIFKLRGISKPTYIDVGANDPLFLSNTAIFYQRGCRGINIEANPLLIEKFKKYRPGDINLNIGITSVSGEFDFYVMADNTLSTFSKAECDHLVLQGNKLADVVKVKTMDMDQVLTRHFGGKFPDLLTLDVEGVDFEILQSINFSKYSPKIVCVEAANYSPIGAGERREEIINLLVSQGYYEYANTNLNAIMVKKEFWFI